MSTLLLSSVDIEVRHVNASFMHVNMHVRVMHMRTWLACSTCLTADLAQEIEELRAVQMAQLLVAGGNERARAKYLARLPESYEEPTLKSSDEELDAWVRNKYQRLKWAAPEVREAASAARAAARQNKPAGEAGAPMQAFSSKEFARKAARGRSAVKAKAAAAAK